MSEIRCVHKWSGGNFCGSPPTLGALSLDLAMELLSRQQVDEDWPRPCPNCIRAAVAALEGRK